MARINITVGEKVNEILKEYSDFMGMTKSGLCAYIVAQYVIKLESLKNCTISDDEEK